MDYSTPMQYVNRVARGPLLVMQRFCSSLEYGFPPFLCAQCFVFEYYCRERPTTFELSCYGWPAIVAKIISGGDRDATQLWKVLL